MPSNLENRILECMKPLFGEFASTALAQQKAKLGMAGSLGPKDYLRLIEGIRAMCSEIAGAAVAERVYQGLVQVVKEGS